MLYYQAYFIAIPIPLLFQAEFAEIVTTITDHHKAVVPVPVQSPHITLAFWERTDPDYLARAVNLMEQRIEELKGHAVEVHGLTVFSGKRQTVVSLGAKVTPSIDEWVRTMRTDLGIEERRAFRPHVTLVRIKGDQSIDAYQQIYGELTRLTQNLVWQFPVSELVLYGSDRSIRPVRHDPIVRIKLEEI